MPLGGGSGPEDADDFQVLHPECTTRGILGALLAHQKTRSPPKLPQALFYRLTVLNLVAYAVFTVFAFTFFVRLPQLNGVTGTVLFGLATYGMARAKPAGT